MNYLGCQQIKMMRTMNEIMTVENPWRVLLKTLRKIFSDIYKYLRRCAMYHEMHFLLDVTVPDS